MMKIAKFFQHNLIEDNFKLYDKNKNIIYSENYFGYWFLKKYDERNNLIYFEELNGYWFLKKFDEKNNLIYYENVYNIILDREE